MSPTRGRSLVDPQASPRHLGIAVAGVVVVRLLSVLHREAPLSALDEGAPLAISRTLAGDTPFILTGLKFDVGWGTLLTPLQWVLHDPDTVFRAVQLLNVGLAVALLLVVRAVVLELFDVSPNLATWAAFVGASMPGAVMQTQYAGSEVAISLGFATHLLLGLRLVRAPSPLTAPAFAVAAVGLFHLHTRLSGLVAVAALVLVVQLVRAPQQRTTTAASLVLLAAGVVIAAGQTERVHELVWATRSNGTDRLAELLDRLDAPWEVLLTTLGMVWQQLVVTFGLAGVGAWAVVRGAIAGTGPNPGSSQFEQDPVAGRVAWGFVLLAGVAGMAPAAVFMADRPLAPHMVYGRYWDPLVVTLVALAVVVLVRARPRVAALAWAGGLGATLLVGGTLALVRQDDIDAAIRTRGLSGGRRIAGLMAYVGEGDSIQVWSITVTAVAVVVALMIAVAMATVAVAGRRWRELMVVATVVLALGATWSARGHHARLDAPSSRWRQGALDLPVDLVQGAGPLAFQVRPRAWQSIRPDVVHTLYQFYQPDVVMLPVRGPEVRSYEWVVADVQDPFLARADAVVVYEFVDGAGLALWHNRDVSDPG